MRADTSENYIPIGMYILSTCASRKNSSSKDGRSTSFLVPKNDEPRRSRKLARSSKEDLPPAEAPQLGRTVEIEILIPPSLIYGIVRDYEEYRKNPIDLVQIRVIIYGPGCSLFFFRNAGHPEFLPALTVLVSHSLSLLNRLEELQSKAANMEDRCGCAYLDLKKVQ